MQVKKALLRNREIFFYIIMCFLSCFAFRQYISSFSGYMIFTAVTGVGSLLGYYLYEKYTIRRNVRKSPLVGIVLFGIFIMQCLYVIAGEMIYCGFKSDAVQWIFSVLIFIIPTCSAVYLYRMWKKQLVTVEELIRVTIFIGFLFRLIYVQFTDINILSRQNDTIAFTNGGGHLGYLWHIWANGTLPNVDPRSLWEFSQPPLYYILCGYWIKISTWLGVPNLEASENLQMFSLLCVTLTSVYLDKILIKMDIKPLYRLWGQLFFLCLPYFTYLSGAANNDVLFVLLTVMVFYYVICWYEKKKVWLLMVSAVLTGLLVMTKLSGGLIAPAILALFILRLIKDKGERGKRIVEYLLFGVVSLPIGLWWNVRNTVRFQMPFFYTNEPDIGSVQYIPDYSIWQRLFDLDNQLNHLYIELFNTSPNVDHNIIISTMKTMVFTHSAEYLLTSVTKFWGVVLFWSVAGGVVIAIVCGIVGMFKSRQKMYLKVTWIVYLFTNIVFYLYYNVEYPFVHTMHVRYILPVFVIGMPWVLEGIKYLVYKIPGAKTKKVCCGVGMGYVLTAFAVLQAYIIEILIQTDVIW